MHRAGILATVVVALTAATLSGQSEPVPNGAKAKRGSRATFSPAPSQQPITAEPGTLQTPPAARPVELKLAVHGEGAHLSHFVQALQLELAGLGITVAEARQNDRRDYTVVFGEGPRNAATGTALDPTGAVVAVGIRGALTQIGAAEAAARDLAKKLAALSR